MHKGGKEEIGYFFHFTKAKPGCKKIKSPAQGCAGKLWPSPELLSSIWAFNLTAVTLVSLEKLFNY